MTLGQEIFVWGNWFILHFTENEGMAFGMRFGGDLGKLMLSIFRLVAIAMIGWYLYNLSKKKAKQGLIISMSLILAGAIGNILDSAFYGLIFSASKFHEVAQIFPADGGYGSFLHGKVVDMFYFPVIRGFILNGFPFGEEINLYFSGLFLTSLILL